MSRDHSTAQLIRGARTSVRFTSGRARRQRGDLVRIAELALKQDESRAPKAISVNPMDSPTMNQPLPMSKPIHIYP